MSFVRSLFVVWSLAIGVTAWADEAAIRKNLGERLPNFPPIDEVSKTPIPGIYELRIGSEVLYTDEQGHYVIEGSLIDTKSRANLTEARIAKLTQIDFASLPLKDAILIKQGSWRAQAGGVRRPQLRLLQEARARPAGAQGRVDLHLPLPDPRPRFERQGARHLVRTRAGQGLARLDGRRQRAAQGDGRLRQLGARTQHGAGQPQPRHRHAGGGVRRRQPIPRRPPGRPAGEAGSSPLPSAPELQRPPALPRGQTPGVRQRARQCSSHAPLPHRAGRSPQPSLSRHVDAAASGGRTSA